MQTKDKIATSTQHTSSLLQEANNLYSQRAKTKDIHFMRQAKDKYTLWLEQNWSNPDKQLVAKALRFRAGTFGGLDEQNRAIRDYEKSIEYDPSGIFQIVICDLKEKQGDSSDLHHCYSKAVTLFENTKTPQKDVNFLLARFFSGDKSAITDYKKFYRASTGREKKVYEMNAQGFFDKATYEEIVKQSFKIKNSPYLCHHTAGNGSFFKF